MTFRPQKLDFTFSHSLNRSSGPPTPDHNGSCDNVVHSPVVLEEEQCDEDWKEERNGKVLVQGPYGGAVGEHKAQTNYILY